MSTLFCDLETFCEVPITNGTYIYAASCEVMLVAWAWDDEPATVWDVTEGEWERWFKAELQKMIDEADEIVVHAKSDFDPVVLRYQGLTVPPEKITNSSVLALQHSLPAGLGELCDVLGVPVDKAKDKAGKKLIQRFCKPAPKNQKIRRATRETHPAEWEAFKVYAGLDVESMREVLKRIPRWNDTPEEREYWLLDQRMNERGVFMDLDLARAALRAFDRTKRTLSKRTHDLTDGAVASTTQRDALLAHFSATYDFEMLDMKKGTVTALMEGELPPGVRALLEIRQEAAAASPAKYKSALKCTSPDGRLRGAIQFCGAARTGRDAGRLFQTQNVPRPTLQPWEIELAIRAMKADCEDLLYENVSEICVNAVRGVIASDDGCKLVVADLSNIEGRVAAWIAGEEWKIKAFREYDAGTGHDLYKIGAARILGKRPEDITKLERQNEGKIPELACLGPGTLVLTSNGLKAITEVQLSDLLWDGIEWVKHAGPIDRGNRKVIRIAGFEISPDHEILAQETWLSAQMVGTSPSCLDLALATGKASLQSLASNSGQWAAFVNSKFSVPAAGNPTTSTHGTSEKGLQRAAQPAQSRLPADGAKTGTDTLTCARMTLTGDVCATESQPHITDAITRTTTPMLITAAEESVSTNPGGRTEAPIWPTSSLSTDGINPNSKWTGSTSTKGTNPEICDSSLAEQIAITSEKFETSKPKSPGYVNVYDIVNAGPRRRFTIISDSGALVVHNCQFGGAVGAFSTMSANFGLSLPEDEIVRIVKAWRAAHPRIKGMWYALEDAMRAAIRFPHERFEVNGLRLDVKDHHGLRWLRIRMPSGTYLSYPNPRIGAPCVRCEATGKTFVAADTEVTCPECDGTGKSDNQIRYDGVDQYTKKWGEITTWGGKTFENCVQKIARDVFMHGFRLAEKAGYTVVTRIHDELVCETPDNDNYTASELSALMATNPPGTLGLPLAAAGHCMYRYGKQD